MTHPAIWPTFDEEIDEKMQLSRDRSLIFGKELVEMLRIYGRYPSLETEEEREAKLIREQITERWKILQTNFKEITPKRLTRSFLWDVILREIEAEKHFNMEIVRLPLQDSEGRYHSITTHRYDIQLENKHWNRAEFTFNDASIRGKQQQFMEELKKRNFLKKYFTKNYMLNT